MQSTHRCAMKLAPFPSALLSTLEQKVAFPEAGQAEHGCWLAGVIGKVNRNLRLCPTFSVLRSQSHSLY